MGAPSWRLLNSGKATEASTWRFLNSGKATGAWNMAVDAALLEAVVAGESTPVFRVYGWSSPAVSLGYNQDAAQELDADRCVEAGVEVVRRLTGGRAVLHWEELTYSLVCGRDELLVGGATQDTYRCGRAATVCRALPGGRIEAVRAGAGARALRPLPLAARSSRSWPRRGWARPLLRERGALGDKVPWQEAGGQRTAQDG